MTAAFALTLTVTVILGTAIALLWNAWDLARWRRAHRAARRRRPVP